jgi:2-polyprenyl-6-hydroxyphenyl methylase/3-demethylubiquinone-9 3-methyltransferase
MSSITSPASGRTLDPAEVERFSRIAGEWWDAHGKFRPLHQIGPARLQFIRQEICTHFSRTGLRPLGGLSLLDIGCGGGLVSEPLARLGARVTGIDPSEDNVRAAAAHAEPQGLAIEYLATRVEDLVGQGRQFDVVLCLEVVEHVPDVGAFLAQCASLVRPGGMMVLSTINRTLKAFALAIVGAEYVLRWLPAGTHQWSRFVTPDELERYVSVAGLRRRALDGLVYDPLRGRWQIGRDVDVNYMMSAVRPPANT